MDELNRRHPEDDPRIFYPDDEVCKFGSMNRGLLYRQQRKIQKRAKERNTCYNRQMLERDCIVGRGMTGLDPDKPEAPQYAQWKRKHPKISKTRRLANQKRANAARQARPLP